MGISAMSALWAIYVISSGTQQSSVSKSSSYVTFYLHQWTVESSPHQQQQHQPSICKAKGLGYILPTWKRKGEWSKVWSHAEPNKSEIDPSRCDTPRQNHRHLGVRLFCVHFHCVHYQIVLLSFQHVLHVLYMHSVASVTFSYYWMTVTWHISAYERSHDGPTCCKFGGTS